MSAGTATSGGTASTARLANCMHLFAIPRNRLLEPVAKRRPGAEAEGGFRARGVECAARLAVRHRGVPHDPALEAGQLCDRLGEVADRDLGPGADVDGSRVVVALRGEEERLRRVLDVEELACR